MENANKDEQTKQTQRLKIDARAEADKKDQQVAMEAQLVTDAAAQTAKKQKEKNAMERKSLREEV